MFKKEDKLAIQGNKNRSKMIRKGDQVYVIAGEHRRSTGTVLSCTYNHVIVQGLNVKKRHMRRTQNSPGKIVELEAPIHISNVRLYVEAGTPVKLKVKKNSDGQRQLVYTKGDQQVVYRSIKKPK